MEQTGYHGRKYRGVYQRNVGGRKPSFFYVECEQMTNPVRARWYDEFGGDTMKQYTKYLRRPSTIIRYVILVVAFLIHNQISPYNGMNRSRYDIFFWTKQWNLDTVVMLLFFLAAISFLIDFFRYAVKAWVKEIVNDIQILKK